MHEQRLFMRIGLVSNVAAMTALIMIGTGFLSSSQNLYLSGGCMVALIHLGLLLASVRFPHFFQILANEIRKTGYEKSLIEDLDLNRTEQRLKNYFSEEKPYLEEKVDSKEIAAAAGLTRGQLSQFLNRHLDIDFRNFINRYRVEEAKEIFRTDSESNVLSVGYKVGFNSKSSFNSAFKKFTGKTPSEYKKTPE